MAVNWTSLAGMKVQAHGYHRRRRRSAQSWCPATAPGPTRAAWTAAAESSAKHLPVSPRNFSPWKCLMTLVENNMQKYKNYFIYIYIYACTHTFTYTLYIYIYWIIIINGKIIFCKWILIFPNGTLQQKIIYLNPFFIGENTNGQTFAQLCVCVGGYIYLHTHIYIHTHKIICNK